MTRSMRFSGYCLIGFVFCLSASSVLGATLLVGAGQNFSKLEDALVKAKSGDTIAVYPLPDGKAYQGPALFVSKERISFRAVTGKNGERVKLDGSGFDYSGRGSIPRAIFQFNPGADGCVVEGFELCNARNESNNGAGVRINQANHVLIKNCDIHRNDMGIMSNGDVGQSTAANQMIVECWIHHNGTDKHAGFNHNLYLGGTSVTLRGCEVSHSTTGHNVKSRAHYNRIEYSCIHDSSNREFDLVDDQTNTVVANSHAVLLGNLIVKADPINGNKTVIHFGQDGGHDHNGTLYLVHNTIVTPYVSSVVDLSAPQAAADLVNNIIWNSGKQASGMTLFLTRNGAALSGTRGANNWVGPGFQMQEGSKLEKARCYWATAGEIPPFVNAPKGEFQLRAMKSTIIDGAVDLDVYLKENLKVIANVPGAPPSSNPFKLFQWMSGRKVEPRPQLGRFDLGAFEAK